MPTGSWSILRESLNEQHDLRMRAIYWLFPILALCFVAFGGCKKREQPVQNAPGEAYGVKFDWPKFDAAFTNSTPESQNSISLIKRFLRYAQFPRAMAELQNLSSNPNLTESQKQLLNDLIEQTKQASAKPASAVP
jgi:hypothetical protein